MVGRREEEARVVSQQDRAKWDAKHARSVLAPPAAKLLSWQSELPRRGRALELACGLGANATWIAANLELQVDAVDISAVALRRLAASAGRLPIQPIVADLDALPLRDAAAYHLVVVTSFLDRALLPALEGLLAPSGVLFYETFNEGYLLEHPDFSRALVLERGELARCFDGLVVVHSTEDATRSAILARKPA